MKKLLILTAIFVLMATSSFAEIASGTSGTLSLTDAGTGLAVHADPDTATATTALIGKTSTGVSISWQTDPNGYALMTQHRSGTKAYGSSYDSTAIYVTTTDAVPGTAAYNSGALDASDTSDFTDANGWKAM